jgi:hypothetical protein
MTNDGAVDVQPIAGQLLQHRHRKFQVRSQLHSLDETGKLGLTYQVSRDAEPLDP